MLLTGLLAGFCCLLQVAGQAQPGPPAAPITVTLSEPYELANVILALTPYGQQDPYEVMKSSRYYREMRAYFAPYAQHPLLAQVNYSRKLWDHYLSFRTDAYAFRFDGQGRLERIKANARPHDETPVFGGNDIRYVLEINGGLAETLGIEPGAEIRHPAIVGAAWSCDG